MDVATRFQSRARAQTFLDRERNDVPDDSGNESESLVRRKFQRTTSDANASNDTFRKPSLPASAMRHVPEQRSSFNHHRRSSTLRENARVPSGPRDFPSSSKRAVSGSVGSLATTTAESAKPSRSFLADNTSEPFFSKSGESTRFSLAHLSSLDDLESPITPAEQADFNFIPSVNFDDLQNSIANYEGNESLLSDFPHIESERQVRKETSSNLARDRDITNRPPVPNSDNREAEIPRSGQVLRDELGGNAGRNQIANTLERKDLNAATALPNSLLLRSRHQSAAPQGPPPSGPAILPVGAGPRAPRKSVGPGIIASITDGRKSSQPLTGGLGEPTNKTGHTRTASTTKSSRRTTIQPSISTVELPRSSTFTAITQSRANKVKSFQPSPHEPEQNTPGARSTAKTNQPRAHTPSSSGNKRQSTVSGRVSGLGARTISPTDARRLKRLSMMQAPPVPGSQLKTIQPEPKDEMPPLRLELPRVAQASPSLIPRKTSTATPTSGRASPELRQHQAAGTGGVSLNAKSNPQSLLNLSASASRLPTPKPRNVHSSSAQYEDEELVPPVPPLPKAYESPRDLESSLLVSSRKSSQSGFGTQPDLPVADLDMNFTYPDSLPQTSTDDLLKGCSDRPRPHQRMNTIENIERSINMASAKQQSKVQIDSNGRRNNNLQPLRLPPLNLMPITQSKSSKGSSLPRPSQEVDNRNDDDFTRTPEPKRVPKTPSTPLTASKATFWRRQDEDLTKEQPLRSSSSHYALRDLMQSGDESSHLFEGVDSDFLSEGMPISMSKQRGAITPFASGSLPKASGELSRQRARPSVEFEGDQTWSHFEDFTIQGTKLQESRSSRSGTKESYKTAETSSLVSSPRAESGPFEIKKISSGGGPRRKLSLGWRRSSSKVSNHLDQKPSAHQDSPALDKEPSKLQKRMSQILSPKVPSSATWTGELPTVPPSVPRTSLESLHRKSVAASTSALQIISNASATDLEAPLVKKKPLHTEQPRVLGTANRATSWSSPNARVTNVKTPVTASRASQTSSFFLATVKDKDDLAADDEMKRLSQKRRDVDTAARESEELRKRAVARSPMSPDRVLHDRHCNLNIFERGEVVDYEKDGVYFTGTKNSRKVIGNLTASPQPSDGKEAKTGNYGYDDERGDYNIVLGDHLAYRYEVVDVLGKGSFGQVVRCVDHKNGGVVAVKIIRNKKRFHQQALVEVSILGRLREWDPDGTHATLSITSSFYFRSHLCIVTPCLSINLYELIRAHNFVGFCLPLIRRFSRQLLSCLVLLQNKRIIHCDLKPENILLCDARKADVRVIDFGSSCKEEEKVYTYIQSRFYRSPEVILGSSYGLGIDMWSLGCILAELWTGYPLFPGENEQEQLACIMEIFGPPDKHLVERCTRKKLFFDSVGKPRVIVSSKGRRRRPSSKTLSQALKIEDEAFLDFITRCLRWDPDRRMKPQEAVNHAFITNQPFHQRPGIPEEARRAARLRGIAAVPATNGSAPSPVKRMSTTSGAVTQTGNTFAQQQIQSTPAKEKVRPLPETPQTALRNTVLTSTVMPNTSHTSPSKQLSVNRRQSTATSAAIAGSKRASNGATLSGAAGGSTVGHRQSSANGAGLAQMAAKEANAARRRA